jgi:hypothetical protein
MLSQIKIEETDEKPVGKKRISSHQNTPVPLPARGNINRCLQITKMDISQ